MKPQLGLATTGLHALSPRGLHHTLKEDFSVYKPAGFVLRWYALTLDLSFFTPIDVFFRMASARTLDRLAAHGDQGRYVLLSALVTLLPIIVYLVIPTWRTGQTLGKRIVGLRVVPLQRDAARLPLGDVLLRETIGKVLSLGCFGLGLTLMRHSPRQRALHDYMGRTVVISYHENGPL